MVFLSFFEIEVTFCLNAAFVRSDVPLATMAAAVHRAAGA